MGCKPFVLDGCDEVAQALPDATLLRESLRKGNEVTV